jgi:transposase-like protein
MMENFREERIKQMGQGKIKKKPHGAAFKLKVVLEALRGEKTVAQLCQEFGVVSSQIFAWKKQLLENGEAAFKQQTAGVTQMELDKLHATIGRLKVENDFLERVLGRSR